MSEKEFGLIIPEEVPAYILNPEAAKAMNEDAAAGISTGRVPRIKCNGKQFVLVDTAGEEKALKPKDLFQAPNEEFYLKMVVLGAKKELQKTFYIKDYDEDGDHTSPDCFSNDGTTPDPSAPAKQSDTCAKCPKNEYKSAKVGDGKACADTKILAVFTKGDIYKLKITPASLRNWATYVKNLSSRGIPVGNVQTLVGFSDTASYPVLEFHFGGWLSEAHVNALAEKAQSDECLDIINDRIVYSGEADEAPAKPAAKAETKKPAPKEDPPPPSDDDDLGLGLDSPGEVKEEEPQQEAAAAPTSDEALAAELGL